MRVLQFRGLIIQPRFGEGFAICWVCRGFGLFAVRQLLQGPISRDNRPFHPVRRSSLSATRFLKYCSKHPAQNCSWKWRFSNLMDWVILLVSLITSVTFSKCWWSDVLIFWFSAKLKTIPEINPINNHKLQTVNTKGVKDMPKCYLVSFFT